MNCYIVALGPEASGQRYARLRFQINIEYVLAAVTIEMAMFPHIWTEPGSATLHGHLPRQSALDKRVQAIINCGHGNIRHRPLGAHEHFLGGRVVALLQKHRVNMLALRRKPKTTYRQSLVQTQIRLVSLSRVHGGLR
jgi:hypothetical protein